MVGVMLQANIRPTMLFQDKFLFKNYTTLPFELNINDMHHKLWCPLHLFIFEAHRKLSLSSMKVNKS
jgi:hypothetical protein